MDAKTSPHSFGPTLHWFQRVFSIGAVLCGSTVTAVAQSPKSLLPVFGTDGLDFTTKAANSNVVKGWQPTNWKDNSEWAPVSATYTKLKDSPVQTEGSVRIKVEKVEEGGQLQLTTYAGVEAV